MEDWIYFIYLLWEGSNECNNSTFIRQFHNRYMYSLPYIKPPLSLLLSHSFWVSRRRWSFPFMRLDFILTLVTLATTSLRTNLKPFAPILNHFGLNSLPPKVLGIDGLDQKERKNLEPKIKEENPTNRVVPCCQEGNVDKVETEKNIEQVFTSKRKAARVKGVVIRKNEKRVRDKKRRRRARQSRRQKSRQRQRQRQSRRRQIRMKTKMNNNKDVTKKKKTTDIKSRRKIPLCLVRCLTANLLHPAHCHVLCSSSWSWR